jgi:hypothetical protein
VKDYRLRNHIPIGAPARREPFVGDEPDLRVSLGFSPSWFNKRLGIDFAERWHLDPVYRYETLLEMKRELNTTFPMVLDFQVKMEDGIERTCATISGVHGIMLVPMLYGIEPLYRVDRWPDAKEGMHIDKARLEHLKPFDLHTHPIMVQLSQQMDTIEERWGEIRGHLNYQGVLNVAMKVRGSEIFLDMYDDPDFARSFFDHIAHTIESVSKLVQQRQRRSGFGVNQLSMSNCVVNMVSPQQYEEFILPHDLRLSKEYERFGVHTCNWDVTPYLDALRRIEKMGYLDTGMTADLVRIREMFPDARRAVLYGPVELENKTLSEIREDIERLAAEYAPCDIVMADVESTTPDSRILDFLRIVEETEARMESLQDGDSLRVTLRSTAEVARWQTH